MNETEIDPQPGRWSAHNRGNRVLYAVVGGWLAWIVTGHPTVWVIPVVAAVIYGVLSLAYRRR